MIIMVNIGSLNSKYILICMIDDDEVSLIKIMAFEGYLFPETAS